MSKKLIGLFCLALLITVAANAATVNQGCGSAGNAAPAQPGPPFPPFTPGIATTTVTCVAFTIPAGQTLSDVQLTFKNDWQLGAAGGPDTLVFTYTITNFNIGGMVSTVTGTGVGGSVVPIGATAGCVASGDIITCDDPVNIVGNGVLQFPAVTITISAAWTAGGLDFSGSEGSTINELLTTSQTQTPPPTPEPASLLMVGSGLIGLALATRRKWKV